ncbi:MAG: MFS transporter [Spirochaetes bacterium]|nr:MFS transporter [Spirochaetota bacterium]MBN2770149.1 MFS transporter [Spirochaetota bacterium]
MTLTAIKIIISVTVILALIYISERNAKLGGIFAGLPIGTGIMVFFYSIEQGNNFMLASIPYAISGLSSTLAFTAGFYVGGKLFVNRPVIKILSSVICSLICYFSVSYLISLINITLLKSLVIFSASTFIASIFFSHIPVQKKIAVKKLTVWSIVFRIAFITLAILIITGVANTIGSKWAGIMASFPSALYPLLLVLAFLYGDQLYPSVIKSFSYSITTIAVFYLAILYLVPVAGIFTATAISYLICSIYIYTLNRLINSRIRLRESKI